MTAASLQIYDTFTGQFIAGTISVDATGRVATFVPSQLLAVNRQHVVYLNSTITDVAGNALQFQVSYFTTGFSTDTSGPTLRLTNPQNGDAAIGRNVKVELQFDRAINAATVGIGVRVHAAGVTVPGSYTLEDGQRRIRFAPANLLAADTTFTVVVTNQLRDLAGNSVINPGSFTFTTGAESDTTAPFVVSSTPAYFEDNVGRLPVIRVVFSEPINSITVNSSTFYLYNTVTGGYARATAQLSSDRMSATLRPDAPLEPYTYYFYFVSVADLVGNTGGLGGIYFRTGGGVDTTPPTVVALDPGGSATNVPVNARVRAVMSEAIDATVVSTSSIQLTPAVAGTVELSVDRRSLTFTPAANLAVSTSYTVQISGLRDSSGNLMATVTSTFTTSASSAADTTPPTIVGVTPANSRHQRPGRDADCHDGERAAPHLRTRRSDARVRVFPQLRLRAAGGKLQRQPGGHHRDFHAGCALSRRRVDHGVHELHRTSPDLAGNPLQSTAFTFTTAPDADTIPPAVVMVTPTDGSTGIGSQAVITLTFSESLHPSTVTNDTIRALRRRRGAQRIDLAIGR